jgi:hypothetical protein
MSDPARRDEEIAEELLEVLRAEEPGPPADLPDRTIGTVRTLLTARELVDLSTAVFVLQFCAPLLDLVAAMLGAATPPQHGRSDDE